MNIFNHRILLFVAVSLLIGNSVFAQTATPIVQSEKSQQLFAQDVSTYVSEEVYALPWARIPNSNIPWQKRVWGNIDAIDPANKTFNNDPANPHKSYLVNILLQAAFDGKIKVYDAVNDRFTKELSRNDLIALVSPGKNNTGFNPDHVNKYRIKEDWLFLKEENKLIRRIMGIAPVIEVKDASGNITEQEMFWAYLPDNRNFMAQQKVFNKNMNWDELLVNQNFSVKVTKVKPWLHQNVPNRK